MRRPRCLGLCLGLLALPLAAPAPAQQAKGAPRFREVFLQLDANSDTVLERDEIPESGRDAFDRLVKRGDANKNGKLEADEMRTLGQKLAALESPASAIARFTAMDKDKDGKVTKIEFTGAVARFAQIDADKDGVLTREEITGFFASQPARPATPAAEVPASPAGRFKALDKDGDGKLSKSEFPRPKQFDRLDADKDGFLTRAELARLKGGNVTP